MAFNRIKKRLIGERQDAFIRLYFAGAICATILIPLILTEYGYPLLHTVLAMILVDVCLYPTARYFARKESGLPTIPIFCGAYALQFALPIFTREAIFRAFNDNIYQEDSDVTAALWLAIIGICAFQAAYYWFQRSRFKGVVPIARLPLNKKKAVLYCVLVGLLLPLLFTFKGIIPEEYQLPLSAILNLLQNQVLVVIGVLGWLVYARKESKFYSVWLYGLVAAAAIRGFSTGMLQDALVPVGVLFIVKWLYTGRPPVAPIVATVALILFLSPVKADYRQEVWYGPTADSEEELSIVGKGRVWVEMATEYWKETLEGNRGFVEATASAAGRTDLIHQIAHIHALTPDVVPYQYGKTYSYFAVAFIPRILWPEKPQAGSANNFYAVSYGITTEEGAKRSTFGVSILGEAFINFGWLGVAMIMLLQGLFISLLHYSYGTSISGPGGQAVFVAFFVFFLNGIGSSTEIMFGGILQNLICGTALLWWARAKEQPRQVVPSALQSPPLLLNPNRN